jgi:hypothetical protein
MCFLEPIEHLASIFQPNIYISVTREPCWEPVPILRHSLTTKRRNCTLGPAQSWGCAPLACRASPRTGANPSRRSVELGVVHHRASSPVCGLCSNN